jgi:hypothetical protein
MFKIEYNEEEEQEPDNTSIPATLLTEYYRKLLKI